MVLCTACDYSKDRGCNVFLYKTPEGITNLPITIYGPLSNFWISGFTRFFAPPRPGPPRGFSLSPRPTPLRGFLPLPRPASQKNAPPRTSLLCSISLSLDRDTGNVNIWTKISCNSVFRPLHTTFLCKWSEQKRHNMGPVGVQMMAG